VCGSGGFPEGGRIEYSTGFGGLSKNYPFAYNLLSVDLLFTLLSSRACYTLNNLESCFFTKDGRAGCDVWESVISLGDRAGTSILFTRRTGGSGMTVHLAYLVIAFAAGAVLGSLLMMVQMSLMQMARETDELYAEIRVHEHR
jgi:hypothetical protein